MRAEIDCTDAYSSADWTCSEAMIHELLKKHKIVDGIQQDAIETIVAKPSSDVFPVEIAIGKHPIAGKDGQVDFALDLSTEKHISKDDVISFRDMMQIPTVKQGQKLARLIPPEAGEPGHDVFGKQVAAKPGKQAVLKAGKNVVYREEDASFYATADGQISLNSPYLHVYAVYEVNESLSMKVGNIDFIGSVVIRGDVPSGYTVKAAGDVKIFGMVEAASIIAGGSIYISEGMSGVKKGELKATEDIHISYMNQGKAYARGNIIVSQSIIHSECTARGMIKCQQGNIIGGVISAGQLVDAKDIGNRLSTKTEVCIGRDYATLEHERTLRAKEKELKETLSKLDYIGQKLAQTNPEDMDAKMRITMLRQKNSYQKTKAKLHDVEEQLLRINAFLGSEREASIVVRNQLYPNVIIAFGKYKRIIKTNHQAVRICLADQEISVQARG